MRLIFHFEKSYGVLKSKRSYLLVEQKYKLELKQNGIENRNLTHF